MRRDLSNWLSSLSSARRSPAGRRMARKSRDARVGLGGGESLERRSMLAVTASVSFGSLRIFLQANGDEATLTSDGTNYTVSGTGFSPTTFALSGVDRISGLGYYGLTNLKFTVGSGSNIVDALSISETIGTAIINQAVVPDSGSISIGSSGSIALNADLTTVDAGISFGGPVTLGGTSADTRTLSAGSGEVAFGSTIDGASKLVVNATGTTVFGGAIGSQTALAGVETNAGGATVIAGATVTTVGAAGQVFNDAVRLQANATFDAGTAPVTFASTVDGGMYLVTDTISVGQRPWFFALSADGTTGYVANEESDTVSVIDTATRAVTATVSVGSQPFDIALSPNGSRLWTANRASPSGSVSVIDTATNTLVQTISTGDFTEFLAFSPDGSQVYASNYGSGTVSVIDTTTLTVVNTISVGAGPRQAVFTPDGSTAYVPNLTDGTVSVIRTSDATVTATITVGSDPYFAAILPNGSKVYVPSYERNGKVSVIDTNPASGTFNTVIATISTGSRSYPQYITISADGSRAYVVVDGYDEMAVINTATDTIVATPTTGNYPVYPALSPDGLSLYVSNISGNTLSVIDTATNINVQEVAVGAAPYGVTVSPDSETIYVVNSDGASVSVVEVNPRFSLTVNSTGLTTFGGAVGGVRPLASVTTNAGGTTKIGGGLVRTTEIAGQSYGDAVELIATTVLQSDLAGPVTFASTLDGPYRLEVIAGEGDLLFKGAVGSVTPLAGLKITSAASTTGESTLALDGASKYANGLWLGPGVSNVSFANGGTIKNFTGNGIYAPDEGIQTLVASRFDFGTDGWKVGNFLVPTPTPTDPDWDFSGGNPGGFISTTDLYGVTAFLAPSQFLGNWAADRVTGLTFNLRVSASAAVNKATVVLSGGGISISTFGPYPTPNDTWVPYTLDLTSRTGWFYTNDGVTPGAAVSAADFATVLANVEALRINAEWSTAPGATVDLDNVVLLANLPNDNLTFRGLTVENNGGAGMYLDTATNVLFADGVIRGNGGAGVTATDGEDITIQFSEISGNAGDGVLFTGSTGLIEGNEIFENGEDGIHVSGLGVGEDDPSFVVNVLGNIVRDNADDGVHFDNGKFVGEDLDVEDNPFSRVAGNTIEGNVDNGVELSDARGVFVGGPSVSSDGILGIPSDINVINLNGHAGVYATGSTFAFVAGNEIDSNARYGVESDGAYGLVVGFPTDELANTIRRNGEAGVYVHGEVEQALVFNNDISENPIGVMLTSVTGNLVVGGPNTFPGEEETLGNRIFDNGEGLRATGSFTEGDAVVLGNLFENNLTGATLASAQGLLFGAPEGEDSSAGNIVQNNNEGLRASGDLTGTTVAGNEFLDNTKVGIALQSAKNLTVG
ncbi:MAG: right-handed parallel beta-helix repeat-containing protein, partial [Planctomycetia bacterium]